VGRTNGAGSGIQKSAFGPLVIDNIKSDPPTGGSICETYGNRNPTPPLIKNNNLHLNVTREPLLANKLYGQLLVKNVL
jgi:hypothetical protein